MPCASLLESTVAACAGGSLHRTVSQSCLCDCLILLSAGCGGKTLRPTCGLQPACPSWAASPLLTGFWTRCVRGGGIFVLLRLLLLLVLPLLRLLVVLPLLQR